MNFFHRSIRTFHRSAFAFARGVRRTLDQPSKPIEENLNGEDENSNLIQEQFARLQAERTEKNQVDNDEEQEDLSNEEFRRPSIDPSTTSILLFPGQGTQFVGMGKQLIHQPNVTEMFNIAHRILGYDLYSKCINGPKEDLDQTQYAQPAIFVTSLAAVQKLKAENPAAVESCVVAAGFSLGEITALVFAGSMTYEDGLRLIKARAEAMQQASNEVDSGMMSVFIGRETKLNLALEAAREWCQRYMKIDVPCIQVANHLYAECKVLAGNREALQFIAHNYQVFGIRRIKYLPVSGAFHTPLMASAKVKLIKALEKIEIQAPLIPVMSNVTGHKHSDNVFTIKRLLAQQLTKSVRWEQIIHKLYQRPKTESFPNTFECGAGRQLGFLLRLNHNRAFQQYRHVDI